MQCLSNEIFLDVNQQASFIFLYSPIYDKIKHPTTKPEGNTTANVYYKMEKTYVSSSLVFWCLESRKANMSILPRTR